MRVAKVSSFLWKWFLRWLFLALPLSALSLTMHGAFLYRPGFWDIWWLLSKWAWLLGISMFLSFPFTFLGLIPGRFYTRFSGLFLCFYLAPVLGIWGIPWLYFALVPLAALGFIFPPRSDRASALVHLVGILLALFVFLHGKMLLEVVLFG